MSTQKTPLSVLKSVFGYDSFRMEQQAIIDNLLNKKDTLAIMPTGGGKSLCYQVPAIIFDGLTVVVSPLISLMQDQIDQLQTQGIPSVMLNSSLDNATYKANMSALASGEIKLLYLAPETLVQPRVLDFIKNIQVDCIAIDEAHCISEWGHEFRPEYRQFAQVRSEFPEAVCIALTATATHQVRNDIRNILGFDEHNEFLSSFDRPNLFLEIKSRQNKRQVIDIINEYPGESGVVYCSSRKQVDTVTADLNKNGVKALAYHAGLGDDIRARNQEEFRTDKVDIIVATIAFGMGINKPDVRFVIHYELPKNLESYYQQIGRAGRDGLESKCVLLFSYGDISKVKYFITQMGETEARQAQVHLNTLVSYCESSDCRRISLLKYFGEEYKKTSCGQCDNCISAKQPEIDLTEGAQKFLSCVIRTGQTFGSTYISDVLKGSQNQKVLERGHDKLSTYGIGKSQAKQEWLFMGNLLLQKGMLHQTEHGGLQTTPEAMKILSGGERFLSRLSPIQNDRLKNASDKPRKKAKHAELENENVFEDLRALRRELATKNGVPPYVIFSDKTLIAMANTLPQSFSELLTISGVGEVKLEKFGEEFLEVLASHNK